MPIGAHQVTVPVVEEMIRFNPKSVFDVGVGFGRWGFLARMYLEVWKDRILKKDWVVQVDGVEIWDEYITPGVKYYYDKIWIGDALEITNGLDRKYDMIIAGDIIEHLKKSSARKLFKRLYEMADKVLIVVIPMGHLEGEEEILGGNPYERHQSWWTEEEMKKLGDCKVQLVKCILGVSAVCVYKK